MERLDRVQLIKDRKELKEFIYNRGKSYSIKILTSNSEHETVLQIVNEIIKDCDEYGENLAGKPNVIDIMSEAFRHVNYMLENIEHGGDIDNEFLYETGGKL